MIRPKGISISSFTRTSYLFRRSRFSYTSPWRMMSQNHRNDSVMIPKTMKIELTASEDRICDLLDECTKYLETQNITTTCRIAGGWVRDKLLGLQSNDIDVALSDIMGLAFAGHLASFAHSKGVKIGAISKIAQNPEQSKHLETATFKIYDVDIDLVNLRSEQYAADSRIPTEVTFGSPLEDARRRDITINALFYNVHTRSVEDFTEKGLEDLNNGIIRTPLAPRETFLDDPLRVLRCIRFSSRFGFELVPELKAAAKDREIQLALESKVARERVGEELSKMMKGRDPLRSICLIQSLSLYESIFSAIPRALYETFTSSPRDPEIAVTAASILDKLLHSSESRLPSIRPTLLSAVNSDPSCKPRLYLAAALTPLGEVSYRGKKNSILPAVELAIRESLKLGTQNHFLDGIPSLFEGARELSRHISQSDTLLINPSERAAIGKLLRNKLVHNPNTGLHWTSSLLFALVQELVPLYAAEDDHLDVDAASRLVDGYNGFVDKIEELELSSAVDATPILDGNQIRSILGKPKGGPWVGEILKHVMEWQLSHPDGSVEDCTQWLSGEYASGNLRVEDETSKPATKRQRTK